MDLTKMPQYQYHIKNNTPTGQVLRALNEYDETCTKKIKELKQNSLAQINRMTKDIQERLEILEDDLKRCEETNRKLDEILNRL